MCSDELPGCTASDTPNISDVLLALADPDVVRAFASAPILYGVDSRPIDGSLYRITYGGRQIDIGDNCRPGSTTCVPPPAGVVRLREFLQRLTMIRMRLGMCSMVFPDGGR